jgi:hypothetical protein
VFFVTRRVEMTALFLTVLLPCTPAPAVKPPPAVKPLTARDLVGVWDLPRWTVVFEPDGSFSAVFGDGSRPPALVGTWRLKGDEVHARCHLVEDRGALRDRVFKVAPTGRADTVLFSKDLQRETKAWVKGKKIPRKRPPGGKTK